MPHHIPPTPSQVQPLRSGCASITQQWVVTLPVVGPLGGITCSTESAYILEWLSHSDRKQNSDAMLSFLSTSRRGQLVVFIYNDKHYDSVVWPHAAGSFINYLTSETLIGLLEIKRNLQSLSQLYKDLVPVFDDSEVRRRCTQISQGFHQRGPLSADEVSQSPAIAADGYCTITASLVGIVQSAVVAIRIAKEGRHGVPAPEQLLSRLLAVVKSLLVLTREKTQQGHEEISFALRHIPKVSNPFDSIGKLHGWASLDVHMSPKQPLYGCPWTCCIHELSFICGASS